MIYPSVLDALVPFNTPLEGKILWPYQDILGLVTVGIGCLIEPVGLSLSLPWVGDPTAVDIRREWQKVDALPKAMHFNRYRDACTLRLSDDGVKQLLETRAHDFEVYLRKGFPGWDDFPADAQLGILGIAWACGPAFWKKFTNFQLAANRRDWSTALRCAKIRTEGNPGVVPRNAQVALCLANAAEIDSPDGYGTPALYWPGHVAPEVPPDVDPRAIPLSVHAARAAELARQRFNVEEYGLTGHGHDFDPSRSDLHDELPTRTDLKKPIA